MGIFEVIKARGGPSAIPVTMKYVSKELKEDEEFLSKGSNFGGGPCQVTRAAVNRFGKYSDIIAGLEGETAGEKKDKDKNKDKDKDKDKEKDKAAEKKPKGEEEEKKMGDAGKSL